MIVKMRMEPTKHHLSGPEMCHGAQIDQSPDYSASFHSLCDSGEMCGYGMLGE